jgi:hypothetical protein
VAMKLIGSCLFVNKKGGKEEEEEEDQLFLLLLLLLFNLDDIWRGLALTGIQTKTSLKKYVGASREVKTQFKMKRILTIYNNNFLNIVCSTK